MSSSSTFFILGYFGYRSNQLDGQTVKTHNVNALFQELVPGQIDFYDTEEMKYGKWSFVRALFSLCRAKHVIYIPGGSNLRQFSGILRFLSRVFKFKIHYFVVGGWLPNVVEKNKKLGNTLRGFDNIFVETEVMQARLTNDLGFKNVSIVTNYRNFQPKVPKQENNALSELKLVFLSRIMRRKGLDSIFQFLEKQHANIIIDFYGPLIPEDKAYFETACGKYPNATYKGIVEQDQIVDVLANYDVLLLPTEFYTEGLPGAIVDAYFAAIPVIVTAWQNAYEFVKHGQTGMIVPFENGFHEFEEAILKMRDDRTYLNQLKVGAANYTSRFHQSTVAKFIQQKIGF
jgi:glycosyltransferase involved in cell wall biosynthesis